MENMQFLREDLKALCANVHKIFTPNEIIREFKEFASKTEEVKEDVLGVDSSDRDILCYSFGNGASSILLYGFPDPGEGVGATGALYLAKKILEKGSALSKLPFTWHIIPCLNFVDQPDNGNSLRKVMKTAAQEVDWCMNNPRPETTALVNLSNKIQPVFTFALHDEFHDENYNPPYIGLAKAVRKEACDKVRNLFAEAEMPLSEENRCKDMGVGFFTMSSIGEEFKLSTFHHISQYGQVLVCEMPNKSGSTAGGLVYLQLACGFLLLGEESTITEN